MPGTPARVELSDNPGAKAGVRPTQGGTPDAGTCGGGCPLARSGISGLSGKVLEARFGVAWPPRRDEFWRDDLHESPPWIRPIEVHRINGLLPSKGLAEIGAAAAHQEVVLGVHEEKRVDPGPETFRELGNQTEEPAPSILVAADSKPAAPTTHHSAPSFRHMKSQRSSHGEGVQPAEAL